MKTLCIPLLALVLGLAACAKEPLAGASAALQAKDFVQADALSAKLLLKKPGHPGAHTLRFVLYRHLSVQGDPAAKTLYLNKSIEEYDKLIKAFGISPNYQDMEGSLRGHPESAALLAANRKLLYGE